MKMYPYSGIHRLLALAVALLGGTVAWGEVPADGFYLWTRGEADAELRTSDGLPVRLGARVDLPVREARMTAVENGNEVFQVSLTLPYDRWFTFDQPGYYEIQGSYYLAFLDPGSDTFTTTWEDYATGAFPIRIEAKASGPVHPVP